MKLFSAFLFVMNLNIAFCQQATREKFSAAEIREDLSYLYKTLEESHYNLYINRSKKTFEREFKKIHNAIKDSMTVLQAHRLFQPFVALSGVGHCNIAYPFSPAYVNYVMNKGSLFPLDITIEEGQLFVTGNYSGDSTIAIGDRILSINGISASKYLSKIYNYMSGEREYLKNTQIDLLFFPRVNWLVYDRTDKYVLKVKHRNGKTTDIKTSAIAAMDYETRAAQKKPLISTDREFKLSDDIAYLRPGVFLNSKGGTSISDDKALEKGQFKYFIDSSFRIMRQSQTSHLIIDLRGNPGGDNSFSDEMISYVADKPFWFCSSFSVKTSALTKSFWQNIKDTQLAVLRQLILENANGKIVEQPIIKFRPQPDSLRFKGKVYVLINRYSYSNAATSAALMQDYQFATIIGEETADAPSLLAAIHQFNLPFTSLTVSYPKARIVRPSGDSTIRGVIPDILVKELPLSKTDGAMDSLFRIIKKEKFTSGK